MGAVASAIFYAIFVWWFGTGLALLLVVRQRRLKSSLIGAILLFPILLYLVAKTAAIGSVFGAYAAFTATIFLWGTQEVAFLTGFVTGPRPQRCPPSVQGSARLNAAIGAILYHELALAGTGLAVLAVTWGETNQIGALTFLILWVMRLSAKINLFLGVPVLNDEMLPEQIDFLRSYFIRGPVNGFFPLSVVLSSLLTGYFVTTATSEYASRATEVGYSLLAVLTALAIIEHAFMLVSLPLERLWRWGTGHVSPRRPHVAPIRQDIDRVNKAAASTQT